MAQMGKPRFSRKIVPGLSHVAQDSRVLDSAGFGASCEDGSSQAPGVGTVLGRPKLLRFIPIPEISSAKHGPPSFCPDLGPDICAHLRNLRFKPVGPQITQMAQMREYRLFELIEEVSGRAPEEHERCRFALALRGRAGKRPQPETGADSVNEITTPNSGRTPRRRKTPAPLTLNRLAPLVSVSPWRNPSARAARG